MKRLDKIIVWDLDGTLTNGDKFIHLITETPKDWDAWWNNVINHKPEQDIIELLEFYNLKGYRNYIITARAEKSRKLTEQWLDYHNIALMIDGMFMRRDNDFRPDYEVKEEIVQAMTDMGIKPDIAFDDRKQCVDMYRRRGIRCLHVREEVF